jgi:predicted MFS family arabinose efflux permease
MTVKETAKPAVWEQTTSQAPPGETIKRGTRTWVLILMTLTYTSSFMDRTVLSIIQNPIKQEFGLSDTQLGLLSGFAFALFYSVLGIPVARLAERMDRRWLIAVSLAIWSGATALGGLARSFASLFALRVAVGVGEAGASPPAHSLITDFFPPNRRGTAFSIYSLGVSAGVLIGSIAGGYIAQSYGWRLTFVIFGVPGLILAILVPLTIREPKRGRLDTPRAGADKVPPLGEVFRRFVHKRALFHCVAGASIAAFGAYSIISFSAPFFIRAHGATLAQAGVFLGLTGGLSAGIGIFFSGQITDWASRRDSRWTVWIPAAGLLLATPLYIAGFLVSSKSAAMAILLVAPALQYLYLGPTMGLMHNLVTPRMRATATAFLYLAVNLFGLGLGPPITGFLSDRFSAALMTGELATRCVPGSVAARTDELCRAAAGTGIRWALVVVTLAFIWSAIHYLIAARSLRRDLQEDEVTP